MNDPVDPNAQANASDPVANSSNAQGSGSDPAAQSSTGKSRGGNLGGIMDDDVDVSSLVSNAGQNQQDSQVLTQMSVPPHPNTKFDEKSFLTLLAGSISLTIGEKKKIIQAIPQLSQFQIDELIKIFQEERGKFDELEKKHAGQIAELESQHGNSNDIEASKAEEETRDKEAQEADDIKRQLGLM